jgi:hypothetical protein
MKKEKINPMTTIWKTGLRISQRNPKIVCLYLALISFSVIAQRKSK